MNLKNTSRALGAFAGIALAGSMVASARPSSEVQSLPARVSVSVPFSGELEPEPAAPHPVLNSVSLEPGASRALTNFDLRNQTGEKLAIGFKADGADSAMDGLLRIRLSSAGAVLADTTLQGLRAGSEPGLALHPGESAEIDVSVWIPAEIETGYESRRADLSLVPEITKAHR
ncbi:MAG: hypothetical protein QOI31_1953 [Solirubrobacterales bacterium]|jgi:hypothetical protein|nr:hypothetical protein [Solirubrobacterales bacterium]